MTAQISEQLHYKGQELALCAEPLGYYLKTVRKDFELEATSTALWRGYVGTWTIEKGHLYLVKLHGFRSTSAAFAICSMINTAKQNNIRSLAMPAIGTGVYKFPLLLAARIISKTLSQYSLMQTDIDLVRICVTNAEVINKFKYALELERDPALTTSSND